MVKSGKAVTEREGSFLGWARQFVRVLNLVEGTQSNVSWHGSFELLCWKTREARTTT